jgi:hypothetical protein
MNPNESTFFDSYLPVYDTVPDTWEEAKPFLVETLKRISNVVNVRTIGFLLDEELLSGQAFIPGVTVPGNNPGVFRSVLRKVVDLGTLALGANAGVPHGIKFDINFTLIDLWVAATDSAGLTALVISGNDVIMDATNIVVTSPQAFDRAFAFIEFIQEL